MSAGPSLILQPWQANYLISETASFDSMNLAGPRLDGHVDFKRARTVALAARFHSQR
jgi:hypothetical protein